MFPRLLTVNTWPSPFQSCCDPCTWPVHPQAIETGTTHGSTHHRRDAEVHTTTDAHADAHTPVTPTRYAPCICPTSRGRPSARRARAPRETRVLPARDARPRTWHVSHMGLRRPGHATKQRARMSMHPAGSMDPIEPTASPPPKPAWARCALVCALGSMRSGMHPGLDALWYAPRRGWRPPRQGAPRVGQG